MVAGGVALGVGMALAKRRLAREGIVYAFFGDGAMGEGAMHECLNVARLWEAPVLFVCESNSVAGGERANAFQAARALIDLAEVHQIQAAAVDAGDPRAVELGMAGAVSAVRSGDGPRFLEVRSQPWPGNRTFLPQLVDGELDLRSADEPPGEDWSAADPVLNEARALRRSGTSLDALLELDRSITTTVAEAFERAAAAPVAPASAALTGVWSAP